MSTGTHADAHGEHEHRSWVFYTVIAVILGVITAVEVAPLFEIFYLPPSALIVLSIIKFAMVVAFFMHLWDDPPIFTQMFVAPLIGGLLMVLVLMVLFHTFRPAPYADSLAVQERYGDAYNGECTSWLRSHRTQRLYCASPPLDKDKVAYLGSVNIDGDGNGVADRIQMPVVEPPDDGGLGDAISAAGSDQEKMAVMMKAGEEVYRNNCQACHQEAGQGVQGVFPPLAQSDYYGDGAKHANIVVNGLQGKIVVNGVEYSGAMQAFGDLLTDAQIAAVITYERNSWGNADGMVLPDQVAAAR